MKNAKFGGLVALTVACLTLPAGADPISDAAGYVKIGVPTNTDVVASVPFTQEAIFAGTVSSVAGSTLNFAGTPFTPNALTNLFYVRATSDTKDGLWSTITANTANSLTLQDASVAGGVSGGDTVSVYPHQTLGTVFPPSLENISYVKSPSAFSRRTVVLELNRTAVGINKSAVATYFYLTDGGEDHWRKFGQLSSANFDNTVLPPDTYFILRNQNATNVLSYLTSGFVEFGTVGRSISNLVVQNDLYAVSGRPVPLTLGELNLGNTPAFQSSPSTFNRKDTILTFDNTASGQNKSANATYFFLAGQGWRKFGPDTNLFDNVAVIEPGAGFIIRKATNSVASSADWQADAPYPQSN